MSTPKTPTVPAAAEATQSTPSASTNKTVRVKTPHTGELSVSYAGDEPVTYKLEGGVADVPEGELVAFLAAFPGSAPSNAEGREVLEQQGGTVPQS